MEGVSGSSATACLWPLLESDVIPCYSRDEPRLDLPGQPWWHQAAMQKGSPAPSDAGVAVPRKHIDIKHEGGFQELSLVQMFLEMNNRFLWEPLCPGKRRSSLGLKKAARRQSDPLRLQAGRRQGRKPKPLLV